MGDSAARGSRSRLNRCGCLSAQPDLRAFLAFPLPFSRIPLIPRIPLISFLDLRGNQSAQQYFRAFCALHAFSFPFPLISLTPLIPLIPRIPLIPLLKLRAKQPAQPDLCAFLAFPLPFSRIPLIPLLKLFAKQSAQQYLRTLCTLPAFTLPLLFPLIPLLPLRDPRAKQSAQQYLRALRALLAFPLPLRAQQSTQSNLHTLCAPEPHRTEESVGGVGGVPLTTLTLLPDNLYKAKCLDGSPPGYYFRPGVGTGANNWLIDLPVGGWCTTVEECAERAGTEFGSTRRWPKVIGGGGAPEGAGAAAASAVADAVYQYTVVRAGGRGEQVGEGGGDKRKERFRCGGRRRVPVFGGECGATGGANSRADGGGRKGSSRGILSTDPRVNPTFHKIVHSPFPIPLVSPSPVQTAAGVRGSSRGILSTDPRVNPTFHNWNLVRFIYCDGGGYAGRVRWKPVNSSLIVYLDGWRISKAIFMDLRTRRGLTSATNIIMSGSSAGGQAVVTLCDQLAEMAPAARTKCLMDSGFFIDSPDRAGVYTFRAMAQRLVGLHLSLGNPRCQRAFPGIESWRCFFPQYALNFVKSPIFVLQSLFDVRALALGNQLPPNIGQATACLGDILKAAPRAGTAIKTRAYRRNRVGVSKLCPAESVAVLNAASDVYTAVQNLMLKKSDLTAFLPGNTQHTYTFNPSWEFVAINGTTVKSAVDAWVEESLRYSRLLAS
ncbi:unnamed protein product [Closterium sp. Yama58-4]|nr:unnamed protein product [Closterium sp. Yama58-4]